MDAINSDRRESRRYAMHLAVRYRMIENGSLVRWGMASTCDISTSGICLRTRKPLAIGSRVELTIEWPVRFGDRYPIDLRASAGVVWSDSRRTALQLTSRQFRVDAAAKTLSPFAAAS